MHDRLFIARNHSLLTHRCLSNIVQQLKRFPTVALIARTLSKCSPHLFQIINLVGSPTQQDVELSALYRDSSANYGERKVLGILANRWDEYHHELHKREARADDSSTSTTPAGPTDEPEIDDAIYSVPGKALIYITSAPVLNINGTSDDEYVLDKHTVATYDAREKESKLIVTFKVDDTAKVLGQYFCLSLFTKKR